MSNSSSQTPLRVALIGCGQIADAHLQELAKLPQAKVIATCDALKDLAVQAAARFNVPAVYDDVAVMLEQERPDVVHIATPAHTHFALAAQCLRAGCHVYVEKPFTQTTQEAEELVELAAQVGRQVCVGHDQLCDPVWLKAVGRIRSGEIGTVTHIESILGYPISGQFGSQVASDSRHWVRRLPGGLFQNTISHPLYRITEFLSDAEPEIEASWARSAGRDFPTELNVLIRGQSVTGVLTFSSQITSQRITRIYGTKSALEIDLDGLTIRRIGPSKAPGAFAKLFTPWGHLTEAMRNTARNVLRFAKADIHYFAGLKGLGGRFLDSIRQGTEPPIPPAEIVRVTRIMDRIFEDARSRSKLTKTDSTSSQMRTAQSQLQEVAS